MDAAEAIEEEEEVLDAAASTTLLDEAPPVLPLPRAPPAHTALPLRPALASASAAAPGSPGPSAALQTTARSARFTGVGASLESSMASSLPSEASLDEAGERRGGESFGLPVHVPLAALSPMARYKAARAVAGEAELLAVASRNKDTLILSRTPKGESLFGHPSSGGGRPSPQRPQSSPLRATQRSGSGGGSRGLGATSGSAGAGFGDDDDDDSYVARHAPRPVWHKNYLDELAYCGTSKARAAERRAEEKRREAAQREAERALYMSGVWVGQSTFSNSKASPVRPGSAAGSPSKRAGSTNGGTSSPSKPALQATLLLSSEDAAAKEARLAAFLNRQQAAQISRDRWLITINQELDYEALVDKKECPKCGTKQTFAEIQGGIIRCGKGACRGAKYKYKLEWEEVRDRFFKRLEQAEVDKAARDAAALEEDTPPFRLVEKLVFDPDAGECLPEPVPSHYWPDVRDEFYERQEAVLKKVAEARAKALEEKLRPVPFSFQPETNGTFRFKRPLPDFASRQASAEARRHMSFEERLDAFGDK